MSLLLDRLRVALADRFLVEQELGRGGMATVYRAHDPKHDRAVALKVLHPELASAIGAERFFREIQIAARLNHPHILPLLDSGQADGLFYYVMPLMMGETLRDRLRREQQLPIPEALRIATQIAAALTHAHRHGVIHRDIKPENILLHEGEVLVADFGIAYAVSGAGERLTESGLSIGTPQYMSPEQATGDRTVDARTDVYALGCVLYEMLVGEPPHTGPTTQAIIAKLMTERPVRLRVLRDSVPVPVDEAVARALAKVPADRFESAEAFAAALTAPAPRKRPMSGRQLALVGGVVLSAAGVIGVRKWLVGRTRARAPVASPKLRQITFTGDGNDVALSPDGKSIAYLADSMTSLVVQDLDGGGRVTIARDTGGLTMPRWSPDGTRILYGTGGQCYCPTAPGPRLFLISRLGGTPRVISLPAGFSMTAYSAFDFGGNDSALVVGVSAANGQAWIYRGVNPGTIRAVSDDSVGEGGQVFRLAGPFDHGILSRIRLSPDGRWLAVAGMSGGRFLIGTVPLSGPRPRLTIVDSVNSDIQTGLEWPTRGDALYFTRIEGSGGAVFRVGIDRATGASRGTVEPVLGGLSAPSNFGISGDGRRLAVMTGLDRSHLTLVRLGTPGGAAPAVTRIPCGTATCLVGTISPDGGRLAFVRSGNGEMDSLDLEVSAMDGSGAERLAGGVSSSPPPVWSPDGRAVLSWSFSSDTARLLAVDVASGRLRVLWRDRMPYLSHLNWAPDGRRIAFHSPRGLIILTDTVEAVVSPDTSYGFPAFSPDGKRLVYRASSSLGGDGSIGVLDLARGTGSTLVRDPELLPMGWKDDSSIFVIRSDSAFGMARTLELLPSRGGRGKVVGLFPKSGFYTDCAAGDVTMSADWRTAVCYEVEPNTDIWLVDDFDAAHR